MAKNKLSSRLQKAKIEIEKEIKKIESQVSEIAYNSEFIAKNTIVIGSTLPSFTQKHGAQLEQYVQLKKLNNGNYQLLAGEFADDEIRYELYYAEYGAGVEKTKSNIPNTYTPTGATRYFKSNKEYWVYPLESTQYVVTPTGKDGYRNYAITNKSTPLNYMSTARNYARQALNNLKFKTKRKIKTTIKRGARNGSEE